MGTKATLLMGTALQATVMLVLAQPASAQPAPNARPLGGSVVGGAATISRTPNNTAINQSSQRAAIDWKSFDVGSQQRVTFNQPSSTAATLNRVTGPDPSRIAGRIDANGQVVLLNQSGVVFYKGAQVNTNGLVVSAIGMSNQSVKGFLDTGKLALDQAGNPNARIDNQGTITIKQAGLAALVAPQVANSGVINAKLGHVVLAGAKTATLDLYGDGLLSLDVTNQVTQAPANKDGTTATALVTNTGVIVADGGTVQLTARAADGIVQNLVRAGGKIRAATMGDQTGSGGAEWRRRIGRRRGAVVGARQRARHDGRQHRSRLEPQCHHRVRREDQCVRQSGRRGRRDRHDISAGQRRTERHTDDDRSQHVHPSRRPDPR